MFQNLPFVLYIWIQIQIGLLLSSCGPVSSSIYSRAEKLPRFERNLVEYTTINKTNQKLFARFFCFDTNWALLISKRFFYLFLQNFLRFGCVCGALDIYAFLPVDCRTWNTTWSSQRRLSFPWGEYRRRSWLLVLKKSSKLFISFYKWKNCDYLAWAKGLIFFSKLSVIVVICFRPWSYFH